MSSGVLREDDARHTAPQALQRSDHDHSVASEATDHLLAAGRAAGAPALRGAELWGLSMGPHGRAGAERGGSSRSRPAGVAAGGGGGLLYLERAVTTIEWGEGLALRYGGFYGPGTSVSLARML